jgi:hypothetical protein
LNPRLQAAREQSAETMINLQRIRRDLKELKDSLHTIAEGNRNGSRRRCNGGTRGRTGAEAEEARATIWPKLTDIMFADPHKVK